MNIRKNIIAFLVISIVGTLSHFLYELTGENRILGLFLPVNESVWEHLKLLFFPTLIYSLAEFSILNEKRENYLCGVTKGVFYGMFTLIIIYYVVNGILGYNIGFINIASYYVSVIVMLVAKNRVISCNKAPFFLNKTACIIILGATTILFMVFTYNSPNLEIFIPPA